MRDGAIETLPSVELLDVAAESTGEAREVLQSEWRFVPVKYGTAVEFPAPQRDASGEVIGYSRERVDLRRWSSGDRTWLIAWHAPSRTFFYRAP